MKKRFSLYYSAALLSLFLLVGCDQKSDLTPTPASGVLSGSVQLWDDKTSTLLDNSGVIVTVEDVSSTSATTDASGKYSFSTLPYGLHDLTLRKPGYGAYRLFGVAHTSRSTGTVLPAVQLGQLATTSVTSVSVVSSTYNSMPGVSVVYSVTPAPSAANRGYVRYFLSTSPTVSSTAYQYASPVRAVLNNSTMGGFSQDELVTAGFKSGQTVYLRLYGESVQSNSYTDPNVGSQVYPNSNPTTVGAVSFVMP